MTDASDWAGRVGDVWADEWRRTDRAFADLSARLNAAILAAAPASRLRGFDIGCGAGDTALALAAARPDAEIVGADLSTTLIAVARDRARGRPGVTFVAGDAPTLAIAEGPFDLLYSRHGVMFFAKPMRAFGQLHAAARAGGALVFSCFADPAANAFAGPLAAALDMPSPTTDGPGPFAFADPGRVAGLLECAGWHDARPERVPFAYRVGAGSDPLADAVAYLSRIGPAAAAMRRADPAGRSHIADRLCAFLQPYARDSVVDLPASAWLWSARA